MKKEIILDSLIKTYLNKHNPISSNELKEICELSFSASTIRNYFQKLDEEGLIIKVHISSGRIPSKEAIRNYWYEHLKYDKININISKVDYVSKKYDVFITMRQKSELKLESVLRVRDRYIILDFGESEIVVRYSKEMFLFFTQFINYSFEDIKKVLITLKLNKIIDKFQRPIMSFNKNYLYRNYKNLSVDDFLSDAIFTIFEYGLSFGSHYLAYKTDVVSQDKENEFIVIGDIYKNYVDIFESIKEEK